MYQGQYQKIAYTRYQYDVNFENRYDFDLK